MADEILCGYLLAKPQMRLEWAGMPYEGYDREYFYTTDFLSDPFGEPKSELWRLQVQCLDKLVYFSSSSETRRLQKQFLENGVTLDALCIRAREDPANRLDDLGRVPRAEECALDEIEFLGFDIGWVMGRHSIIYQPNFLKHSTPELRAQWAMKLNTSGLFGDVNNAMEFREQQYRMEGYSMCDKYVLSVFRLRAGSP